MTFEMKKLDDFLYEIKCSRISGSYQLATQTVMFVQKIILGTDWKNVSSMVEQIRMIGKELMKKQPTETVMDNMIKRVLKIIREECNEEDNCFGSVKTILTGVTPEKENVQAVDMAALKDSICLALGELLSELETNREIIAQQGLEHIYWDENIMTIGRSQTVEAFMKYVDQKKRKFQVIVAECAPDNNGHDLALSLSKDNINTILIHDSAIFSVMSRVNKVIIGAHLIMANGGIKAVSGAYSLALAAKHYSVPFIVCTGMYKLTPHYLISHDQLEFNKFSSSSKILSYEEPYSTKCQVENPVFDYVPPELITIFISNIGGTTPSDVYRLLRELYHENDEFE